MEKKEIFIAICDDDPAMRNNLRELLPTMTLPENMELHLTEVSSGDDLIALYTEGNTFNIIFLDMIMPGSDGIQTARRIREKDDQTIIIYLTSSPDYALQSYRVEAFDYLLKTDRLEQIAPVFEKAIGLFASKEIQRLHIRSGTTTHSVLSSNIETIEINGKKLFFHLNSGQVLETYKPIRELEADIEGIHQFFKIHRSIIVNLGYLTQIDPKFVMTVSGQKLPVARGKYEELERTFLSYSAAKL